MHNLILFLLLCYTCSTQAQTAIEKPEYVVIAEDKLMTKEKLNQIDADRIKGMYKGVSQEERDSLAVKYGEKIGEREFIMVVDLYRKDENRTESVDLQTTSKLTAEVEKTEGIVPQAGDQAPDFTVQTTDGKEIQLSELKGKVVLLNFWATWCAPCLMEFHEIPDKIIRRFENKDVIFLPISRGEEKELVFKKLAWLQDRGIKFSSGLDPEEKIWEQYGSKGIPKNFIINKEGIVQYVSTGYGERKVDRIAQEIEKLIEE